MLYLHILTVESSRLVTGRLDEGNVCLRVKADDGVRCNLAPVCQKLQTVYLHVNRNHFKTVVMNMWLTCRGLCLDTNICQISKKCCIYDICIHSSGDQTLVF